MPIKTKSLYLNIILIIKNRKIMKKNIIIITLAITTIISTTMWVITQQDFEGMQELFGDMQELYNDCVRNK